MVGRILRQRNQQIILLKSEILLGCVEIGRIRNFGLQFVKVHGFGHDIREAGVLCPRLLMSVGLDDEGKNRSVFVTRIGSQDTE
ncbi:MAG: hypothetical protein BWY82_02777 [Verrucomicrobia bacterium ADurb.Bin474]|nr:MAG: hypothetical protein BWY82_02777 [Verrucomicrobia bacterium ADurb.Bin474]